jgi:uncharacterized membrane protein
MQFNFYYDQSIFLVYVITGVVLLLAGWYVQRNPPSHINPVYGYRTPRAKMSKENWDFAQKFSARLMVQAGLLLCILGVIGGFIPPQDNLWFMMVSVFLLIGIILFPIFLTERELKKRDHN